MIRASNNSERRAGEYKWRLQQLLVNIADACSTFVTLFLLEGLALFPELSKSCLNVDPPTSSHFFAANRHLFHTSPFMQLSSCRECSSVTEREGRSEENPCTSPRFCILESFAEVGLQTAKPLDSSGCILPPLAGLAVLHTLYFAL